MKFSWLKDGKNKVIALLGVVILMGATSLTGQKETVENLSQEIQRLEEQVQLEQDKYQTLQQDYQALEKTYQEFQTEHAEVIALGKAEQAAAKKRKAEADKQKKAAQTAIKQAETSKKSEDIKLAQRQIDAVSDKKVKADLQEKLDSLAQEISEKEEKEKIKLEAENAVKTLEATPRRDQLNLVTEKVAAVQDEALKTDLTTRIHAVKTVIEKEEAAIAASQSAEQAAAAKAAAETQVVPQQGFVTAPAPAADTVSVYYANCSAVRAAGAAPIYEGQPGYARHLDRDGDGIGCER